MGFYIPGIPSIIGCCIPIIGGIPPIIGCNIPCPGIALPICCPGIALNEGGCCCIIGCCIIGAGVCIGGAIILKFWVVVTIAMRDFGENTFRTLLPVREMKAVFQLVCPISKAIYRQKGSLAVPSWIRWGSTRLTSSPGVWARWHRHRPNDRSHQVSGAAFFSEHRRLPNEPVDIHHQQVWHAARASGC